MKLVVGVVIDEKLIQQNHEDSTINDVINKCCNDLRFAKLQQIINNIHLRDGAVGKKRDRKNAGEGTILFHCSKNLMMVL